MHDFVRSATTLFACIFAAALLLMPLAWNHSGSSGPAGLAAAGAICLISGLAAEALVGAIGQSSPLGATLLGLMLRMFAPLAVCVVILATGQSGREHLHFIGYPLTFYMLTLALETWLAVKRASAAGATTSKKSQR
jgi:hypothetical protein